MQQLCVIFLHHHSAHLSIEKYTQLKHHHISIQSTITLYHRMHCFVVWCSLATNTKQTNHTLPKEDYRALIHAEIIFRHPLFVQLFLVCFPPNSLLHLCVLFL
jgi:hypothetical protein